jgi:hypothetical protein
MSRTVGSSANVYVGARTLCSVLSALQHEIHAVATPSANTIVVGATVTYWFLSGGQISPPVVTTFQMRDSEVTHIQLDMDMAVLRRATWNTTCHAVVVSSPPLSLESQMQQDASSGAASTGMRRIVTVPPGYSG